MDGAAAGPEWRPDEFGLRRALLLACIPVCAGVAAAVSALSVTTPPPPPPPIVVQLAEPEASAAAPGAPALASAAEPETLVPPELAPAPQEMAMAMAPAALSAPPLVPLADLVEAESNIQLAPTPEPIADWPPTQASAVRHTLVRPRAVPRPSRATAAVAESIVKPSAAAPAQVARAAPPPPPDTSSGIGPYRAGLHAQIERNMMADEGIRRLGIGGVAVIEAVIAPDGRVLSTVLERSSGNRAIDRAAQEAVQRGGYRPFGAHMPPGPITISVPITVGDG